MEGLAPTSLAESWDNVGLLIEPSGSKEVGRSVNLIVCKDPSSGQESLADKRPDRACPVGGSGGESGHGHLLPPSPLQTPQKAHQGQLERTGKETFSSDNSLLLTIQRLLFAVLRKELQCFHLTPHGTLSMAGSTTGYLNPMAQARLVTAWKIKHRERERNGTEKEREAEKRKNNSAKCWGGRKMSRRGKKGRLVLKC